MCEMGKKDLLYARREKMRPRGAVPAAGDGVGIWKTRWRRSS
jgi:hypothetical protein